MAENVKVIVRCRPINKKEADTKLKVLILSIFFFEITRKLNFSR